MDAEVFEIPPPVPRSSKPLKQKEPFVHEVIDIDDDEDPGDAVIIEKELNKIKKGKAVMDVSDGRLNGYSEESLADHMYIPPDDLVGAMNGTELNGLEEGSHNSYNADAPFYDFVSYDDDYMDYIIEDGVHHDDDYDLLQAHFDSMDIPPGVEAPVPWLPDISKTEKSGAGNTVQSSGSLHPETAAFAVKTESFGWTQPATFEMNATFNSTSGSLSQANSAGHPPQVDPSAPWLPTQSVQTKKNRAGRKGSSRNFSFGFESFKSRRLLESLKNKKSPVSSSNSTNFSPSSQFAGAKQPHGVNPHNWDQSMTAHGVNEPTVSVSSSYSSFPQAVSGSSSYPSFPQQIFSQNKPSSPDPFKTWMKDPSKYSLNHSYASPATYPTFIEPFAPSVYTLPEEDTDDCQVPQSLTGDHSNDTDDVVRRFENFKRFDTVQDHSDHHYSASGSSVKQPPKSWAKRIQEEWKILEKDLPDTIFVRVYETRMDLLRAVIVGAEGTPYHDGLYFFDVFFPLGYPSCPPHVYYHSRGLRINPNLYNTGKVCLSLLNTWSGHKNEKWMPGVSTILQVLVSIQGLILNAKPYFNEPGYASMEGSAKGEKNSLKYNEDTFILSLRTMTYVIRTPPKHFEDFVMGHFYKRAQDILVACKAYVEGAQVGCLVRGGVQDVDAGDKSCSSQFKQTVAGYIGILAKAFMKIGAQECERFLAPPPPPMEIKRQVGGVTIIEPLD
ncbi:hypothetical protein CDL15_Pgr002428 [Punica granatum]|uniref:E2 ubiquitin-conjugating enzyme n=1 Tax=Punica granatum TaxID=22663 RepID=A0A218XVX3_PUNGR|nr:hypothetical protein CDL15_Pgr002428 [Punica granatum]PKI37627.1 hypothetical protein CRG98_041920 [Punica granatum]